MTTSDGAALERFDALRLEFASRWSRVRHLSDAGFVREDCHERNEALALDLAPAPPRRFLHHPSILFQMFVGDKYLADELPYVSARLEDLREAREDAVGCPPSAPLPGTGWTTSANTVHHLHHLLRYEEETGRRIDGAKVFVEWGAGYGNLAKLIHRRHGNRPTLVLLDTPVFSCLQWLYLASVLGEEAVVLHTERGQPVQDRRINVVPIGLVAGLAVQPDVFISTWALNESEPAAQDAVIARNWFGAPGLLLAMHEGDPLERRVLEAGARRVPVGPFMPAQRYLVR